MHVIEANNHFEKLTNNIRFAYDTSVLPSESYAALDSVISVIKTYEQEGFRYIFRGVPNLNKKLFVFLIERRYSL
ncbi:hypothetical protein H8B06_13875 [Sphingobacterium sp. DN00404]|uniref:Uncharacterized protein n=1 Tax=Sphingobacterium micropteri TaxID=2763501 RepID=A0ABR7YRN2_9SPHI|nr:hypothetical protein [Sphingobacterium micropteri]MBD1433922.1 hypothetical protein [Sphingobacterium micropteri]